MNYFKSIFLLLLSIVLLSSCATRSKYVAEQKSWIGQNVGAYIIKFGYPNNILKINDDEKAYVYTKTAINPQAGRYGAPYDTMVYMQVRTAPQIAEMYALTCTTWVVIDSKTKIIKQITFRGNNCVAG